MRKIDLAEKLARITDHWSPRIVAELNGQHVKIAKLHGEFVWHRHEHEDELFLVLRGTLEIELRGESARSVTLGPGELVVVPRGVEHRPIAREEVEILLFEPAGTVNTGDAGGDRTVTPEWV